MGLLTAVREVFVGDDGDAGTASGDGREPRASPSPPESEADFVIETGRTRKEFLLELVEAYDGRVKQADLVTLTDWSKATVSRHLSDLESDGAIDRVRIGRCKVVLLPGESLLDERAVPATARR